MEISSFLTSGIKYQASKVTSSKVTESKECTEAEKLEAFKKEIWSELDSMPWSSRVSVSIQITEGAFKRMMNDKDFKEEMMNVMREEAIASAHPLIGTSLTWISESGYEGYSYCQEQPGAFQSHSSQKDSFYSKKAVKKNSYEEEWEKRALDRAYQQKMLDREYYEELIDKKLQNQKGDAAKRYEQNLQDFGIYDNGGSAVSDQVI